MMNKLLSLFLLFPFISYADVKLDSIEVSGLGVSEDLIGLASENAPLSVETLKSDVLELNRIKSVNDITILDAALTNNYSGSGYWDSLNIRGFAVDNRTNYFRDGLRINAQVPLALENKESVEVIKGLGGFQTSGANPSGSINFRTKRAQESRLLRAEFTERGGYLVHLDFGAVVNKLSYRFNLLNEEIRSPFNFNDGNRNLVSAAFSYQLSSNSLLEAEVEWSRNSQQTLGAQSFWGTSLPSANPTTNLNNQSWVKPVEFESVFYSLRYTHELGDAWILGLSSGRQESKTNDRMSYAFGCSFENNWDSYCSDGTFDISDYRSEGERRITNSSKLSLSKVFEGYITHDLSVNIRYTHQNEKVGYKASNYVGIGNQSGVSVPSDSSKTDPSTNLIEDNIELFVVDSMKLNSWELWIGGNVQNRYLSTFKNDNSQKNKSSESFFTPWMALSHKFDFGSMYLSYTQGKESWVTPNKPKYTNPTKILPQQTTHQYELGLKSEYLSSALFYLNRPRLYDDGKRFEIEGFYQQFGWENNLRFDVANTAHEVSLMYLQVKQFAPGVHGKTAPNIPDLSLRYQGRVNLDYIDLGLRVQYESSRFASYDNKLGIPDWIKWDVFIEKKWTDLIIRAYVDNIFQKRFWKESPLQYGHHYLYQGAGRRAGVQATYHF